MCELLAKTTDQKELLAVIAFFFGLLLDLFPSLVEWERWKKMLLSAGIGFVIPVGAFFIGAAQACWAVTWDVAMPYVLAGLIAAVTALGGNLTVAGARAVKAQFK